MKHNFFKKKSLILDFRYKSNKPVSSAQSGPGMYPNLMRGPMMPGMGGMPMMPMMGMMPPYMGAMYPGRMPNAMVPANRMGLNYGMSKAGLPQQGVKAKVNAGPVKLEEEPGVQLKSR
jgi:hypothetical protein